SEDGEPRRHGRRVLRRPRRPRPPPLLAVSRRSAIPFDHVVGQVGDEALLGAVGEVAESLLESHRGGPGDAPAELLGEPDASVGVHHPGDVVSWSSGPARPTTISRNRRSCWGSSRWVPSRRGRRAGDRHGPSRRWLPGRWLWPRWAGGATEG